MTQWTPQQLAAIEAADRGESTACDSVAGSGKTTVEVAQVERVALKKRRVQAVAFAKRNQLDLQERMPQGVDCRTLNGTGHRSCMKALPKITLATGYGGRAKTYEILNSFGVDLEEIRDIARAVGIAKSRLLVPHNAQGGIKPSDEEEWENVWEDYDLDKGSFDLATAALITEDIMRESIKRGWTGMIDFDDQIYMPLVFRFPFEKYDAIAVDEAQDLNKAQHLMIDRMSNPDTQHLLAGDPRQAIYAFRGALGSSFAILKDRLKCSSYPLTVSFRCPKAVVAEAQRIVPEIESHPSAIEGLVENSSALDAKYGDVILCRNTKPLIPVFYHLLRAGLPAKILGSEIGKGLATILKKIQKQWGNVSSNTAGIYVTRWVEEEVTRHAAKGRPERAAAREQQGDVLHAILDKSRDIQEAIKTIESMFSDSIAPITLSTIHKAKGLEWKRVWLLDKDLMPSRFAKSPEDFQQENNLLYVAITRAQQELRYISSGDIQ